MNRQNLFADGRQVDPNSPVLNQYELLLTDNSLSWSYIEPTTLDVLTLNLNAIQLNKEQINKSPIKLNQINYGTLKAFMNTSPFQLDEITKNSPEQRLRCDVSLIEVRWFLMHFIFRLLFELFESGPDENKQEINEIILTEQNGECNAFAQ